jgi:predicted DNA-binding transcriptional regulator AlpA
MSHHRSDVPPLVAPAPRRIIRVPEALQRLGFEDRSTIYRLVKRGRLPQFVRLSRNCVGFDSLEFDLALQRLIDERDAAPPPPKRGRQAKAEAHVD